jgi:Big-like domain-containing protein
MLVELRGGCRCSRLRPTRGVISPDLPVPVTTVTSSQDPSTFGQKVTSTATIAPADGGTITFSNGSAELCAAVPLTHAGGSTYKAKCATTAAALPAGFNTITAAYPGDTRYAPSAGTLTQTVAQAPRTPAPPAPPPARDRRPDPAGRKRRRTYQGQLPRNRQLPALIGNHDPAVTAAALQGQPARSMALWAR